jgi:type II secretory pathway pseudopilin PulG
MTMLIFGIIIGVGATLLFQEVHHSIDRYKERKQLEFEAAVQHALDRRIDDAQRRHPSARESEWNNIRLVATGTDDDPFADV